MFWYMVEAYVRDLQCDGCGRFRSGNVLKSGRSLETDSWVHKTPSHSSVETKLRELLLHLGREEQILGVQVRVLVRQIYIFL